MSHTRAAGQVVLAHDHSALRVLHALLAGAVAAFPAVLGTVRLPATPEVFRRVYPTLLPQFEAARLASQERYEIARHLTTALARYVCWQDDSGQRPLQDALREPAAPLALETHAFAGAVGWRPDLVYRGERWDASRLTDFGALLVERRLVTPEAGNALAWVGEELLGAEGLSLTGRKIAVLGGGAEMAPTRLWLEAGADVLWLDTQPPPRSWWESPGMSGRLFWPADNVDLLANPREVLATLTAFAEGRPLDLGLYAYAAGQARELRLTATMNAVVNALEPGLVGSVTALVSPTTPAALSPRDIAAMRERLEARPVWEMLCARLSLLGTGGGCVAVGDAAATRSVVAIQGASYQAAQYLGKILMAECWSHYGLLGTADPMPVRVSANTAAITRTRSLAHPVFAAAFGGAAALGVETLAPRQSRRINGLLALCDWLHPALPAPGAVRVHGGVHTLPYPLESALRVAAAIGFARSPRLLRGLITR
jgi:hypothetical protein